MKALQILPAEYSKIYKVNLQKDKRTAAFINILSVLIGVAMAIPAHFYIPITTLFNMEKGILNYFLRFVVLFVSIIIYMILHELIHGVTMKICGTKKVKYGFTGLYAFAGSKDYYDKNSYIAIALMPVIVFFFVFLILCFMLPKEWFWVVCLLQITNISGATGDFFVTVKFLQFPKDILISDSGVEMTVYSKQK